MKMAMNRERDTMHITHVRIDDRLIHGQVATLWANSLGINRIMVIDDIVATNEVQKLALKLAVPKRISLSVFPVNLAAERLNQNLYISQRLMIIIRNPLNLLQLMKLGVQFDVVNIGVLSNRPRAEQINHDIYISDNEKDQVKELLNLGVKVIYQAGPNSVATDFLSLLGE